MTKHEFDSLIRQNLAQKEGAEQFGYGEGGRYKNYYTEADFQDFLKTMEEDYSEAYADYVEGKGGETDCGATPPKMASVASSSRFCYLALRNGGQALGASGKPRFEQACAVDGIRGTAPQMDACFAEGNLYVEVKCHEIFDEHKIILSTQYWPWFYGEGNGFGFPVQAKPDAKTFTLSPALFAADQPMMDLKQFLCHLMGVASRKNKEKPATLCYLFFKPKTDDAETAAKVDAVFEGLRKEIKKVFECKSVSKFIGRHHITLKAAAEYAETMGDLTEDNIEWLYL